MKVSKWLSALLVFVLLLGQLGVAKAAEPELSKLVLTKNELTLEIGGTASLTATAVYVDGTTANVTISTTWSSDTPSVASVYNGTISAKSEGTAIVMATYKGKPQAVQVTVTKKVKTLTKDTQKVQLRMNEKKTVALTATYQDNTTEDVTALAEWSSSDDSIATVVNGTITGIGPGAATITAKLGSQTVTIPVDVEIVKRLDPSKSEVSLLLKDKAKVGLTATYPDGTTRDVSAEAEWSTSDPKIADVIKGEITAYGAGQAIIKAEYGTQSATIEVDVDKTSKIEVNADNAFLRVGATQKLTLTATYPSGTSSDVTSLAKWTSSDEKVASVSKGTVSANSAGAATITAAYGGKTVTVSIDVEVPRFLETPNELLAIRAKTSQELSLKATYANGVTEDVSKKAIWTSSNEDIASVVNGKLFASARGEAKLTATYGGKSVKITVQVDVPSKLTLSAKTVSLEIDETFAPTLIAVYADGREEAVTDKAEWSTSAEKIAEVSSSGVITGKASGSATITAKYETRSVTLKANVALADKLTADVRSLFLNSNESKPIKLTAVTAAGKTVDVTADAEWKSSNVKVADVTNGIVTGYSRGETKITASYGGKSVTVSVEVDVIQKLEANKRTLSLKSGQASQLELTVTFNDGSKKTVTSDADWSSNSYKVADVENGKVTAVAYGKATITAKYGNKTVTVAVDVDTLKYLQTDKVNVVMKAGTTSAVIATATYSDGSESNVSKPALWSSSKTSVADVKDGVIRAHGKGKATITVSYAGKKAKVTVEVQ